MAHSTNSAFRRPRPLYLLTTELCSTYKRINQRYYAQQKRRRTWSGQLAAKSSASTATNFDYDVKAGEVLADRFVVGGLLGKGSFGQVVRAFDRQRRCYVAIKIIKRQRAFFEQAATEIRILRHIERQDPAGNSHIVRLLDSFVHEKHQCLVFETLSLNLYELVRETQYNGVSLHLVRNLARQLLEALGFLRAHHIIHCDLKPENILLCNAHHSKVKVIDLGSSCFDNEQLYTYLQSRFYRAPEILLGLDYGTQIDMWSLGCILVELHTGEPLFNGASEGEQVLNMCQVLGTPPLRILRRARNWARYFRLERGLAYRLRRPLHPDSRRSLSSIVGVETGGPNGNRSHEAHGHERIDYLRFVNLLERMLEYDPAKRITPHEALQHAFFRTSSSKSTNTAKQTTTVRKTEPGTALTREEQQAREPAYCE